MLTSCDARIQSENKTLASVTFQNYFRLYDKLSGVTGTALTEQDEFLEIYNLGVVEIPTTVTFGGGASPGDFVHLTTAADCSGGSSEPASEPASQGGRKGQGPLRQGAG